MIAERVTGLAARPAAWPMLLLVGLLGCAMVAGILARWSILPDRPLAVDEYYTVRSVQFVLEHGVPLFPTGGYYTRGLPQQYAMAGAAMVLGETHLAYRLPSFLFSLVSIVLGYLYARRFTTRPVAMAVATALLVSSWHVEFAGFARMYAVFQCVVLLFLIAVDRAFFRGAWRWRYVPHLLAGLAVLSQAIGIIFTPLLFMPLIAGGPPGGFQSAFARLRFAVAGLVTTGLCLAFLRTGFRNWGVTEALPAGYLPPPMAGGINVPVFPFWSLGGDPFGPLLLAFGLAAAGLGLVWLLTRGQRITIVDAWLVALLVCVTVHTFALAAIPCLVLLLRHDLHQPARHPRRTYVMLGVAVLIAIVWLTVALISPQVLNDPAIAARWDLGEAALLKALWTTFFGWPDVHRTTIVPFLVEMPLTGLLLVGALATDLIVHRHDPLPELLRRPWSILVLTLLVYGVVEGPYIRLRYWYHLYPVMLCLIALAVTELTARAAQVRPGLQPRADLLAALGFLGLFALTSDFDPRHLARSAGDRASFRTGEFEDHARTWYERFDFVTPAAFVNAQDLDEQARVVVEYQYPVSYYLEPAHAIYIPQEWGDLFPLHSREQGTVDLWSGARLLGTPAELAAYTRSAREVWLIRGTDRTRPELPDPAAVWGERRVGQERVFLSRDGRIEILRVTLDGP